jgi:hypothetical protein
MKIIWSTSPQREQIQTYSRPAKISFFDTRKMEKHPLEASDSWKVFLDRKVSRARSNTSIRRNLRHEDNQEKLNDQDILLTLEQEEERTYWEKQQEKRSKEEAKQLKKEQKHIAKVKKLYRNPGIADTTVRVDGKLQIYFLTKITS